MILHPPPPLPTDNWGEVGNTFSGVQTFIPVTTCMHYSLGTPFPAVCSTPPLAPNPVREPPALCAPVI